MSSTLIQAEASVFKEIMAHVPAGVAIVTTYGLGNEPRGFTASSFTSLSVNPPLVLVCIDNSARCFETFSSSHHFSLNIASPSNTATVATFASKKEDKFDDGAGWDFSTPAPRLLNSAGYLGCTLHESIPAGDHSILIGAVEDIDWNGETPLMYFGRRLHTLPEMG